MPREFSEYSPESEEDKGITRRKFLKMLGIGAATVAIGESGRRVVNSLSEQNTENQEAESEAKMAELLGAPTENIKVAGSGEDLGAEGANTPRCFSELREAAGWPAEYEDEFEKLVKEKNPDGVSDDLQTIYPGIFEVPVNKKSETGLETAE